MVSTFRAACKETGIDVVVSHDSYLVNLCAPTDDIRERSVNGLKGELRRCQKYGIRWVVSHIGAHKGFGEDATIPIAAENVREVLADTDETMLLAETTAGQGSSLSSTFEGMAKLLDACGASDRLGVCLDTCHIFAAGYDIRTEETYERTMAEFDRLVGFDKLRVIHCNDSKKGFNSRVDRHANIGDGEIGLTAFRLLVNDPRFFDIPILIETPNAPQGHKKDLATLWGLCTDLA